MITGLALALLTSACTVDSSPEAIVATASEALQKDDLSQFQETLSGSALDQYGTQEGVTILQNVLQGAKIRMTPPQSVAVEPTVDGRLIVYTMSVLAQKSGQKLLDLMVNCDINESPPKPQSEQQHCLIDAIQIDHQ